MEKHFVTFYIVTFYGPGTFCAETNECPIDSWNVDEALKMSKEITQRYGAKPYGFRFFTRSISDDELDSHVANRSGIYYINGVIKTLEDIKAENNSSNRILISNMEINGWDKVVQTRSPYLLPQPFSEGDQIVYIQE